MQSKQHYFFGLISVFVSFFMATVALATTTTAQPITGNKIQSHESDVGVVLKQLYEKYKTNQEGQVADYIPELAKVNPANFGIALVTIDGRVYSAGDAAMPFAIESISKIFAYALALEDNGEQRLLDKIGYNATGKPFNSVIAIEEMPLHRQNPAVNAGAIQVTSAIAGKNSEDKWQRVFKFMNALSDNKLFLGEKVYQSEMATNEHNRAIAELMNSYQLMYGDTSDAVDRYTKACSVMVTANELAMMGATLANNGVNPLTKKEIIPQPYVQIILSQMVVNGLYEHSGAWWTNVGLPAKSGVGGGILAIVPHRFAIAVFSPRLDEAGNSVRATLVISDLAKQWDLHMLH